jgi:hypothetical protein
MQNHQPLYTTQGQIESFVAPIWGQILIIDTSEHQGLVLKMDTQNLRDGVSEPSSLLTITVSTMHMVRLVHPLIWATLESLAMEKKNSA